MLAFAGLTLTASVSVLILGKYQPETVQVRTPGGWVEIQSPLTEPVVLAQPDLRVPGHPPRFYPGTVVVTSRNGKLVLVNHVEEDAYLEGLLAGEAETRHPEALEALAIAARSMIPFLRGRHQEADVCDLTHCQVYSGATGSSTIREAVRCTRGRVLLFRGRPALAPYHSTCGGETSPPDEFFSTEAPYLQGVRDEGLCRRSPHYEWEVDLSPSQVARVFGLPAPVDDFRVEERHPSGRVRYASGGGRRMSGVEIYRAAGEALGWAVVKSTRFEVAFRRGRYRIRGRGLGHGVGLCQWGADAMAREGGTAEEVLAFYYPGTEVSR